MSSVTTLRPYPGALLNPKVDPIFKSLFTQNTKESNAALTAFLSAMLHQPITDVPEAFMISVLNFVYDESIDDGFLEYTMRLEDGKNLKSTRMKIIYLELPKYEDIPDYPIEKLTTVEKWAKFFLYSNRKDKQEYLKLLVETEAGIMNAQESLDSISQSEAEWIRETAYWDAVSNRKTIIGTAERRGLKQGMEKGLQQGIQQGIQQTKNETARNLKNNGVSIEIIAKCTGLSVEEVETL